MNEKMIQVGNRIREHRKAKKMTQNELGEAIGKTESSVAKYEKGKVEIPNSVLTNIAQALDTSAIYLQYGEITDDMTKEELVNSMSEAIKAIEGPPALRAILERHGLSYLDSRVLLEDYKGFLREHNMTHGELQHLLADLQQLSILELGIQDE